MYGTGWNSNFHRILLPKSCYTWAKLEHQPNASSELARLVHKTKAYFIIWTRGVVGNCSKFVEKHFSKASDMQKQFSNDLVTVISSWQVFNIMVKLVIHLER